jgi:hypothetical protein
MSNRLQFVERTVGGAVQRLAVSDLASIYGCCGFFDMCGDGDLMSLSFAGTQPFLDILNFQPSNVCKIRKEFLTWVKGGVGDVGRSSHGVIADPCGDPYGVAYGTCSFELEDFGRLRTAGPVRDITKLGLKLCENSPRYRLDGAPITDDMEYGIRKTCSTSWCTARTPWAAASRVWSIWLSAATRRQTATSARAWTASWLTGITTAWTAARA